MIQIKKLLEKFFNKSHGQSLETRLKNLSDTDLRRIPGYLTYPNDPLSQRMFGSKMQEVCDKRCGYRFLLYTDIADPSPEIRQQTPPFDINETHIFWKPDSSAFCSVSTMKAPSVKTSNLRGWVESTDRMGMLFGDMTPFLNLPSGLANGEYRRVEMHDLGECAAYNKLHGFEETHVWCHVFYLGDTLYKKFILCAKRDDFSWKAECTFPSDSEALLPTDAVPPGQVFDSFFPAE